MRLYSAYFTVCVKSLVFPMFMEMQLLNVLSVGIIKHDQAGRATCYELDRLGIVSRCGGEISAHPLNGPGPTQHPIQWVQSVFPGVKLSDCGIDHPTLLV
jgi:hypothetical protein